jgi:branched-chain amino acid transport system substrate-binding protein
MKKLKIGFLMPYSGIYPYYGHHMMAGLQLGMQPAGIHKNRAIGTVDCDFVPVFTKRGDPATLRNAMEQLLFFERVDILSGLVSYRTMPELLPLINKHHRPAIFFDLGEHIPYREAISPYVFYASQQIWQSEYALGAWSQEKFRNPGLVVMPIYESGYQLHSSFWEGVQSAGGQALHIHTLAREKSDHQVLDLATFFDAIAKEKPAFVHGIFTGNQGLDFIRQWIQSPYYNKIPLVLIENMAYEDMLDDILETDVTFYTASSWSREDENPENQKFVHKFESSSGQKANIFALLGYEAGLFMREIHAAVLKGDTMQAIEWLHRESIKGPRGFRNFDPLNIRSLDSVNIFRMQVHNKSIRKLIVGQAGGGLMSAERRETITAQSVSGWQNPFLCV